MCDSPGARHTVSAVFIHGAAGRTGKSIFTVCFSPMPCAVNTRCPSPGTAVALTGRLIVSDAPSASFTKPTPDAQAAEPSTFSSYVAVSSFPLRFESVSVALNVSPGAAKRGASACITSFGVTFACTAPAPVARAL